MIFDVITYSQKILSGHIRPNSAIFGDCLEYLPLVESKSVDLILCDLPYGMTKCHWDSQIPLFEHYYFEGIVFETIEKFQKYLQKNKIVLENIEVFKRQGLWHHYERIIKDNGAILLFAANPFDKMLAMSNMKLYKYDWVWEKTQATGFLNAKKMPLKAHENICVFYKKPPTYNIIKTTGHKPINSYTKRADVQNKTSVYGKVAKDVSGGGETERYPRTVIKFSSDKQKNKLNGTIHPTQKPLALCEFLIKTFSNEGMVILDNAAGSFTTAIAADGLNRKWICMEQDKVEFDKAMKRMELFEKK